MRKIRFEFPGTVEPYPHEYKSRDTTKIILLMGCAAISTKEHRVQ